MDFNTYLNFLNKKVSKIFCLNTSTNTLWRFTVSKRSQIDLTLPLNPMGWHLRLLHRSMR